MTHEESVRQAVVGAIARVFDFPQGEITDKTSAVDVPGWDSISHAFVIMEIEEALGTELPLEQIVEAANVGEMVAIIVGAQAAPGAA